MHTRVYKDKHDNEQAKGKYIMQHNSVNSANIENGKFKFSADTLCEHRGFVWWRLPQLGEFIISCYVVVLSQS